MNNFGMSNFQSLNNQSASGLQRATLGALNAELIMDCVGAAQIAFHFPQVGPAGMNVIYEGINDLASTPVWTVQRWINPVIPAVNTGSDVVTLGMQALVACGGFTRIRSRVSSYTSGSCQVVGKVLYVPAAPDIISLVSSVSSVTSFSTGAFHGANSDTTTVLAANAVFTGSSRSVGASSSLFFYADFFSNQASATGGCAIEKSIDAFVTAILATPPQSLTAGVPVNMRAPITAAQYRVKYTNGATLQTAPFSITSATKTF
jgi:hypothetical protein